ncbi:MAG: hypothetical protein GY841_12380 [FCB group bacterium]|nr:hypothetical protein [FCB group bacterium]
MKSNKRLDPAEYQHFIAGLKQLLKRDWHRQHKSFAIKAGITPEHLSEVLAGRKAFSYATMLLIASAAGTTYEELVRRGESITGAPAAKGDIANKISLDVLSGADLDRGDIVNILAMVADLSRQLKNEKALSADLLEHIKRLEKRKDQAECKTQKDAGEPISITPESLKKNHGTNT